MGNVNELDALRSELAAMRAELDELKSTPSERPPDEDSELSTFEIPEVVTRRGWMKAAAAAAVAVGGTAIALGSAQPAAAASNFEIGSTTNADTGRTEANHDSTTGSGVSFLFHNTSPFNGRRRRLSGGARRLQRHRGSTVRGVRIQRDDLGRRLWSRRGEQVAAGCWCVR